MTDVPADSFQYIDVERTIAEFGYDPRELSRESNRLVVWFCQCCKTEKNIQFYRAKKQKICNNCKIYNKSKHSDEILQYIDIDETLSICGNNVHDLKMGSNKKVVAICPSCEEKRQVRFHVFNKHKKCKNCACKENGLKGVKRGKDNPWFGKKGQDNPNYGRKHSEETIKKKSGVNSWNFGKKGQDSPNYGRKHSEETIKKFSGENNHFFGKKHSDETKKRLSEIALSQKRKLSPDHIEKLRACSKLNLGALSHRYGKPAPHITGQWYEKAEGKRVWLRSLWEVKFATWLDFNNKKWESEPKTFPVSYISNKTGIMKEGTYTPDFLVEGEWFEIKGFWRDDAKPKFEAFKAQYPDEKITLLMKPELLALGIDVK